MGLVSSDGRNGCGKTKQSHSTQGRGAGAGRARAGNGFSVDLLRSGRPRLKSLLIYSSGVQTAVLGRAFQKAFSRPKEAAPGGFDPSRSSLRTKVLSLKGQQGAEPATFQGCPGDPRSLSQKPAKNGNFFFLPCPSLTPNVLPHLQKKPQSYKLPFHHHLSHCAEIPFIFHSAIHGRWDGENPKKMGARNNQGNIYIIIIRVIGKFWWLCISKQTHVHLLRRFFTCSTTKSPPDPSMC